MSFVFFELRLSKELRLQVLFLFVLFQFHCLNDIVCELHLFELYLFELHVFVWFLFCLDVSYLNFEF